MLMLPGLAGVPKPHVLKLEAHADVLGRRRQVEGVGSVHDVGRLVEQLRQVADVHERLRDASINHSRFHPGGWAIYIYTCFVYIYMCVPYHNTHHLFLHFFRDNEVVEGMNE